MLNPATVADEGDDLCRRIAEAVELTMLRISGTEDFDGEAEDTEMLADLLVHCLTRVANCIHEGLDAILNDAEDEDDDDTLWFSGEMN